MDWLLGLACFFVVMTVVGHGLWLLAASIFRTLAGSPRSAPATRHGEPREECPDCDAPVRPDDRRCGNCGLALDGRHAKQFDRLRTAQRVVQSLTEWKELDRETAERVLAGIDNRIRKMRLPPDGPAVEKSPPRARPVAEPQADPASPEPIPVARSVPSEDVRPPVKDEELLSPGPESTPGSVLLPEPVPSLPAEPRRSVLTRFMEDRNILVGELIGGLLIVGCSVALVLTLWRSLEALPYFPFLLSSVITGALFAAGLYTLHHWKLASTSRGLLIISLLLAPLNLLLLANPGTGAIGGWVDVAVGIAAALSFAGLVRAAGRDLIGVGVLPGPIDRRWLLAVAVVGSPLVPVLFRDSGSLSIWIPLLCHVLACGAVLAGFVWYRGRDDRQPLTAEQGQSVLTFVGLSFFALVAVGAFLATQSSNLTETLSALAVPLAIAAVPVLEAGLLVHRRTVGQPGLRFAGTAVAATGTALLLAATSLAWPHPGSLTLIAVLFGLLFTREAWRNEAPWFQAGAIPAFGLALVLGVLGVAGQWVVPEGASATMTLAESMGNTTSAITLVAFGLLLALLSEVVIRFGLLAQSRAYAFGGMGAGAIGLFLATIHGVEQPGLAAGVHAACVIGLLASNVRWQSRAVTEIGLWLVLVGTLWALWFAIPTDRPMWSPVVAVESLAFAILAAVLVGRSGMSSYFRSGAVNVSLAAGIGSIVLGVSAPGFPNGDSVSATLFTLAAAGFVLTYVLSRPWPTWVASTLACLGALHLTTDAIPVRPVRLAVLLALLSHATLAVAAAFAIRRREKSRSFGEPLRLTGLISSALAVPFLLMPVTGMAPEWTAFAVWVAALWFIQAWVWRERGAFSASQVALTVAALFGALIWVERQPWGADGLEIRDPRTGQAFGVALALLGVAWVVVRRLTVSNTRLRELWHHDPFAVDRVVMAGCVIGCLVALSLAVIPGLFTELTPLGQGDVFFHQSVSSTAFGPGSGLVVGLLSLGILARLRFVTNDEPGDDETVLGAGLLALCVPITGAGSFAPEMATASALRWGLAVAFLVASVLLFVRRPILDSARRLGFRMRLTRVATVGTYAIAATAAVVVLWLTLMVAQTGLAGQTPTGPGAESFFAKIGWTPSNVIPLALLVAGLSISAIRERSSGYAFAGGLVFLATVTGGYALVVVTGGGSIGGPEQIRLGLLAVGSCALWALVWLAGEKRVPGGVLLVAQVAMGIVGLAVLAAIPLVAMLSEPHEPLPAVFGDLGLGGWVSLILAGAAAYAFDSRHKPTDRPHVVGFVAVVAGVFAACSVIAGDTSGRGISLYTMAAVWAGAGLLLNTYFRSPWGVALSVGIAAVAILGPTPEIGRWPAPLILAGYGVALSGITRNATAQNIWPRTSLVVIGFVTAGLSVVLAVSRIGLPERVVGPLCLGILAVSFALARHRIASIVLAVAGVTLIGWAGPDPDGTAIWLKRNAWAFVALVAATAFALNVRFRNNLGEWASGFRDVGRGLFPASIGALVVILLQQVSVFDPITKRTPLDLAAVLTVLVAIASLIALSIRFALRPTADPYGLPEPRRTFYVYLAEVILVLFFVHVRFNLPELFIGQAVRYWTFLVMLLAFVGIGLAELFERRGVRVLAVPLRRTGALLPLIPLLAFWAKPPASLLLLADEHAPGARPFLGYLENLPQHFDSYAWLWFLAGTLYGLVSLSKRSFGWGLLGALAVNAGLWALLTHNGVSPALHPQVWAIPLSLIILVSEHINRRELPAQISAGLRYLGIGMLYLSSSADLFIAGVGESVWLPVVLALFCVAGVFAGILFRVRAFLFLGAGFLALDVFAMIWHAAVGRDQTWVWYASGIVLGVAILALFAVFEKRKADILAAVGKIREWD